MNKTLILLVVIASSMWLSGCKKNWNCIGEFKAHTGNYILRDSTVQSTGNVSIVIDTITADQPAGFGHQFTFHGFGSNGIFFLVDDCPENFTIEKVVYGSGTYSGKGSFKGNNLTLHVHVSTPGFMPTDSSDHYCTGIKQ